MKNITHRSGIFGCAILSLLLIPVLVLLASILENALPGFRSEIGYAAIFLGLVYFLLKDGMKGRSIGKRLCGIVVIQVDSGMPCSKGASVVRNLVSFFGIFDIVFLFGGNGRRLGDLAAGTGVIKLAYYSPEEWALSA